MTQADTKPRRAEPRQTLHAVAAEPVVSSPDGVFHEIVNGLSDGRYVPGQKLIESDLTRRFKVSRGSVREALKRLAAEGLVKLTLHRGAYIRTLSRSEVRDVMLLNEVAIGLAARLAAERIKEPGAETAFREAFARMADHAEAQNFFEFYRARKSFYDTLVQIGRNRELARLLGGIHLVEIQFRTYPITPIDVRLNYYTQLRDAILSGDAERAERLGRSHTRHFLENIERLPDEAFPPDE